MTAAAFEFIDRIADLGRERWNALAGTEYPFLRYEYLHALEASWSVCPRAGWRPCHLVAQDAEGPWALLPLYEKTHSWGEYVFDWSWAEAYHRHGRGYYPKLVTSVPFTPCQGPRLLLRAGCEAGLPDLVAAVQDRARMRRCSSWHLLFPDGAGQALLESQPLPDWQPLLKRLGVQFHWRNAGYGSFAEFLERFTSRKRKNLRKERDSVRAQGIDFVWLEGEEVTDALLDRFYVFYQATYLKHGQRGYLTRDFFARLLTEMPEQVFMVLARQGGREVAAAWFLKSRTTLYGRYWGCLEEFDHLHFETCYYQGIEYCIAQGLSWFDAGAQGEHKLLRGFEPYYTCSYHWLVDEDFREAVADFLERERQSLAEYKKEAASLLPYRAEQSLGN